MKGINTIIVSLTLAMLGIFAAGCSQATDVSPMPSKSVVADGLKKQIEEVDKSNFTPEQKAARKAYLQKQLDDIEKAK